MERVHAREDNADGCRDRSRAYGLLVGVDRHGGSVITTTTRTTTPGVVIEAPPPDVVVTDQADCTKTKVTKTDEATGDTVSKTKTRCD